MRWRTFAMATVLTSLSLYVSLAIAGSTGSIKGRITHKETGLPVIGATVLVVGTTSGAMTDFDGYYQILRLEPGTYTLRVSHLEFQTVEITDVIVEVDSIFEVNQLMTPKVTDLDQTIRVIGTPDHLDKFVVDSRVTISGETIKQQPVRTVDALLTQVAGVQTSAQGEVFIRGARAGEVSYIVGGVPIGCPLGGQPSVCPPGFPPAHGGNAIVNDEAYDAMFFKNHGVNPFVDTEDDHFSTFAIDVDDASFIMTRSYLERGNLPPEEAVRVEEFVNHFDYDYEPPETEAFRVVLEGAPAKFGPANSYMLRVGIKGREIARKDRKDANLVFVVDVSGSMGREDRLGLVKKSLHLLLDQLTYRDRVGIVVYGSTGWVHLNSTPASEIGTIRQAIDVLHTDGATCAEQGIRLGYEMASRYFDKDRINRVILCSDGVANVGQTGPDDILKAIEQHSRRGITLTSVGFGMGNYNDILMEKLGNKGNGFYAYVDDIAEARRLFVENSVATLQVIARDVKIQVDFDPGVVRSYRLLGYENRDVEDDKFRDDTEDGGEIGAGHTVTALYELKLKEGVSSGLVGRVFLRFKDPDSGEVTEVAHPCHVAGFTPTFEAASNDFQLAAAAAEFAEILRGSYWARGSKPADVRPLAQRLLDKTGGADVAELVTLLGTSERLLFQLAEE